MERKALTLELTAEDQVVVTKVKGEEQSLSASACAKALWQEKA